MTEKKKIDEKELEEIPSTDLDDKESSDTESDIKSPSELHPPPLAPPPSPPSPLPKKETPREGIGLSLRTQLMSELKEVLAQKGILVESRTKTARSFIQAPIPERGIISPTPQKKQEIETAPEQKIATPKIVIDEIISLVTERLKEEFSGVKDQIDILKQDLSKKDDTLEAIENWLEKISLQKTEASIIETSETEVPSPEIHIPESSIPESGPPTSDTPASTTIQPSVSEEVIKPVEVKEEKEEEPEIAPISIKEPKIIPEVKKVPEPPPIKDQKIKEKQPEFEEVPSETKEIQVKKPVLEPEIESKKINIYFISTIGPGEKKHKLLIDTKTTVSELKDTLSNIYGLNAGSFHLSLAGITMDENNALTQYNMNEGDEILLIPASTAGKFFK